MYIPNSKFLAQFVWEFSEEQTQKKGENPTKKPLVFFMTVRDWNGAEKSRPLRPLLNVHTKFQLPSSIWREVMRGTNLENVKKRPKTIFQGCEGVKWSWKSKPPKGTSGPLRNVPVPTYKISTYWFNLEGDGRTALFQGHKGGNPYISPPNWLVGLIFWYVIQLLIFYRLAKKVANLGVLTSQHPLLQIGA